MILLICKIIILTLLIILLGFAVEIFKFDYEAHSAPVVLFLDTIIIIYITFNMIVMLLWP